MFLDTSGLLCCANKADLRHAEALTLFKTARGRLTHNYVLAELLALAHVRKVPRRTTLAFLAKVEASPVIETVWVDPALHRAARGLLEKQLDKDYSLCDAVSFELMRRRNILEALTTDRHFEQAGFTRLLK